MKRKKKHGHEGESNVNNNDSAWCIKDLRYFPISLSLHVSYVMHGVSCSVPRLTAKRDSGFSIFSC